MPEEHEFQINFTLKDKKNPKFDITGWETLKGLDFHDVEEKWNDEHRYHPEMQMNFIRQVR